MQYGFGAWETKQETLLNRRSINDIKACEIKLIRFCCERMLKERELEVQRLAILKEENPDDAVISRKHRDENTRYREDKRLVEDVELALELNRWSIPTLEDVEKMVELGCAESFKPVQLQEVGVHSELGPFPYPGADIDKLKEYRSFLDDNPTYAEVLARKSRNLLLRIQMIHLFRQYALSIDLHACNDVWVLDGTTSNGFLIY